MKGRSTVFSVSGVATAALCLLSLCLPRGGQAASPLAQGYTALRTLHHLQEVAQEADDEGKLRDDEALLYLVELFFESGIPSNDVVESRRQAFVRGAMFPHAIARVPNIWDSDGDNFVHVWETANFYTALVALTQHEDFRGDKDLIAFSLGALLHYRAERATNALTAIFAGGFFGETGEDYVPRWDLTEGLPIGGSGDPVDPVANPLAFIAAVDGPFADEVRSRHYFFESWITSWLMDTEAVREDHEDGFEKDLKNYYVGNFTTDEARLVSAAFHEIYDPSFGLASPPDPSNGFRYLPELIGLQIQALKGDMPSEITVSDSFLDWAMESSGLKLLWNFPEPGKVGRFTQALNATSVLNITPDFRQLENKTLSALKEQIPEEVIEDMRRAAEVLRVNRSDELMLSDLGLEDVNLYSGEIVTASEMPRIPDRNYLLEEETYSHLYASLSQPTQLLIHGLQNTGRIVANVADAIADLPLGEPGQVLASPRGRETLVLGFRQALIARLYDDELASFNREDFPDEYTVSLPGTPAGACYFPDGRLLAVVSGGGQVIVYDTLADLIVMEVTLDFSGQMRGEDVAVHPNGQEIFVLVSDGWGKDAGAGFIYTIGLGDPPAVSQRSLMEGSEPFRMVYDPIQELLVILTKKVYTGLISQRPIVYYDPSSGLSYRCSPRVAVWNEVFRRVDTAIWFSWVLEERTILLLPITVSMCGFGVPAYLMCMINFTIIATIDAALLPLMGWAMKILHMTYYVSLDWDPLSIDWFAQGFCLALGIMSGGLTLPNFLMDFIIGQMCNFSAKTRAQPTYLDVMAPVDLAVSPATIYDKYRITSAVIAERTGNIGVITDELQSIGASYVPELHAATINRMGEEYFGAGWREKDKKYGRTFGRAITVNQLGNFVAAREFNEERGAKELQFTTLWRPRLDNVLIDTPEYLPEARQLRMASRMWSALSILSLSERPKDDRIRYTSFPAIFQITLTLGTTSYPTGSVPLGYELWNSEMASVEQKLPAYNADVEKIISDEEGSSDYFGGSQRIRGLASRPTYVLRHTNVFGTPRSEGIVFEVEGRRSIDDIDLYIVPADRSLLNASPLNPSDYSWSYRAQDKRMVRIAVKNLSELPGMGTAGDFLACVDVTYNNPSILAEPITVSLFTGGKTGTVVETESGVIRLETVDVNNDWIRYHFNQETGVTPPYTFLNADLGTGGMKEPNRVVCDGVSLIMLRAKVPAEGQVAFTLLPGDRKKTGIGEDGKHQNGELRKLDEALQLGHVTANSFEFGPANPDDRILVDTVEVDGEYVAFALYRPPEDFARYDTTTKKPIEEDRELAERQIIFTASFEPSDPDEAKPANVARPMVLARKPIIFIHDIGNGPDAWDLFGRLGRTTASHPGYPADLRIYVDYSASNMGCYSHNTREIAEKITDALKTLRNNKGYAVARADVVAHGSAAILARLWAAGELEGDAALDYEDYKNFKQGYIHRLITLGAPFQGSPLANFGLGMLARTTADARAVIAGASVPGMSQPAGESVAAERFYRGFLGALFGAGAGSGDEIGAVLDLSVHSANRRALFGVDIKTHTVALGISTGSPEHTAMGSLEGGPIEALWRLMAMGYQPELLADHTNRMTTRPVLTIAGQVIHLIDRFQAMGTWGSALVEHNEVVSWQSQNGELGQTGGKKECTSFVNQSHFAALKSEAAGALPPVPTINAAQYSTFNTAEEAVIALLDLPMEAKGFADRLPDLLGRWGYPSPFVRNIVGLPGGADGCDYTRPTAPLPPPPVSGDTPTSRVVVIEPADGTVYMPGSVVPIRIQAGSTVQSVMLVTSTGVVALPLDDSTVNLQLPSRRTGQFYMGVLARDNNGFLYGGPRLSLTIAGDGGAPLSMDVRNSNLSLNSPGSQGQIEVIFSDPEGDWIPAPGDPSITYTSSDTTVVEVDASGRVRGLVPGAADVHVSRGDLKSRIRVTVGKPAAEKPSPVSPE